MKELIRCGGLGTSAHNHQPWKFIVGEDYLEVALASEHLLPQMDPSGHQAYMALGTAVENIRAAARGIGLMPEVEPPAVSEDGAVIRIRLQPGPAPTDQEKSLHQAVTERFTNRNPHDGRPVEPEVWGDLEEALRPFGIKMHVVSSANGVRRVSRLIGSAERFGLEHAGTVDETYDWLRFSDQSYAEKGDGLWMRTMGFGPAVALAAKFVFKWNRIRLLNLAGFSRVYGLRSRRTASKSASWVLLTVEDSSPAGFIVAGEGYQRFLLRAHEHNLAIHPMTYLVMVCIMLAERPDCMTKSQRRRAEAFDREMRAGFGMEDREYPLIAMRIGYAPPPVFLARRRKPVVEYAPAASVSPEDRPTAVLEEVGV
ncbi:hypothetical protein [Paenibacillus glufosinatiresistens]|uniref:hypothetical protein n=1 Tax=Paenibacillus glufosinatiresistens TaxID=3070657 RepID=UPI00286E26CD|nr:hypothetical protein [Paenibacillus sp. YX.27]